MVTNISTTNTVNSNIGAHENMAHAGQTGGGNWLQQAGSWLGSDSMSQGMGGMGGMSNGQMILAADQTGGQIFGMLAGQNETTAGNIIKKIPGMSTIGNLVNAAFGSHINEGFVKQTEFGINSTGSQAFNSNTNADVLNDWKNLVQLSHVNKSDVGSDGWFSKKAKRKTNALNEAIDEANALQLTNFGHAVANADQNTDLRIAQGMIAAYGGPINSFRKYYNDGGNLFNTPQFFTFEPPVYDDGGYLSKAKALIRQNEGWRAKPYKDAPKGKAWRSVGYGFNDSGFREKYPEGISKHYEHGITKEQAEQELEYYLRKSEKTLKNIYGKQWDGFTDNQKAAILDTYYQSPASVGKKSRFYKAVTAGEDAGKYLGVAGYSKRNNVRQGVFGGGAVPKSSGASYSSGYSNVDMASSSGAGQIDTEELSYPSPILEGRSPIVDFDFSGIKPTKVIDPKINLSRPAMDLNFMSSPITQAPQPQAPTVGTVEDFLASYGDIDDSMLFAHGGFLGRQYNGGGSYSYTKPLDNVFVDSEGNVIDPSVPSAKGTIRTPDVVIATRDPRKVVPTANVLNPSSLSLSNFLDKNKIYNRIPGDEWYNVVNEDRKSNYGISGPFDALQAYFLNDDDYVLNRLSRYMPYKNVSWREKEKAAQDFAEKSRKVKYKFDTLSDTAKHRLEMLQDKSEALPVLQHEDAKAVYLGLPQRTNTLRDAEYSPTQGKLNNGKYITYMREPTFVEDVLMPIYNDLKLGRKRIGGKKVAGEVLSLPKYANSIEEITPKGNAVVHIPFLNNATMSSGHDGRGEYLSIFDTWDYNTGVYAKPGDNIGKHINGKPFDIYDRIYLDDYYGTPEEYRGSTYIPEVTVTAKRRKHEFGGNLFPDGGSTGNTNGWLDFFKSWNQSQGGNNYFNMDNGWKPSDGLQRNTSNGSVQDWIGVAQTVGNTIANWGKEDPSLGRGGGYSMFGMAAYDLLKGVRDATKSKRESIDQKLGIPIYACGGRLYPDGGALGGVGAESGGSVGAMGYAQVGTAALKLASNAVNQAKLTVDEDKIDRSINRYGYGFDEYASRVNTNGDLLDLWQNNAIVNPNLTARDFRDKSEFDDFLNSYAASWEGFNAGQNFGNAGAIVGAVVGGLSSRIGSQIGKNKAKHAAEEANEGIKNANERRQATLEYLAERVDQENDLRILQDMDKRNINSGASGGDLNMGFGLRNPFIMPDGVANPLYRSFGGGLTHGVNWDTGVNWVDEGGSHGENPLGGVPMGVDDQGIPNLVEEGEAIWNGDYVFSKRMKVPKKLAKKYGLGSDITFADAIKKLTKDSEERPLSMIDRDTNDHILGEFADVQEEKRMAKAQRAMEREQQLQEDFMTGFQYGLGGHLSPFGIVPNSDNISPFEKAEQQFEDGGGIHIDPSKRGTFKAQASKMGMGVQEAASHILANKENYSPAMVKKAAFAHNFAHADGGDLFTNPFAYGGEMGNIFAGPGNRPNALRVSTQSPIRRMFGDTVGSFVENVTDAVNDPIGYFAGDEIDAAMERVSKMSKPQLEKFFKTRLGQKVAQYIVDSESNSGSRNYQQASVRGGRAIARAGQRAARPLVRETVAMAKRAVAQSKAAARSQGKAPAASRASQASRASAPTPTTAQQAYRQAANRDLQRGTQWAENARNARPTQGTTYESYAGSVPNRYPRTYSSSNPYAQLAGTLEFGSTTPWGTIGAVGGGAATLGTAAAIAAASDNARGAANTRRAAAPARTNTGLSAQLDARLDAMDNAPWMDMSAITGPSYLTPAELQAMGQQQAAQAAAAQAASNRRRGNGAASVPTTRGSVGNVARTAAPVVGETGLNLYDWYRNGSDGISEPTGFTVGENGLIDRKTGYTQEYRDLVKKRTADDIRKWAAKHPNDPSLQSFLANNGPDALNKLTDEQWRTGALDGKYGFMHHVADSMLNEKAPAKKAASVAPAGVSEVELPQQELLLVDPKIAEDPARIAKGTRTTTVDESGTKVTRITDPDAAKNNNTGNGKFKPRDTWMRQVPIWMSGLAALRGELTPPDYTNADAILSAAYAAGRPVSVGTEYVGDYRVRDPFDERYLMNIINQNAAATRENLMNFSGGNRAVAMAGMSNNDLTRQMALAEAARQAYLANRADDVQVSDFNYRTNKGNADAQNTRNLALAQLNSGRQNAMLSGISQGARLRQAIKDQRDAAISANWTAFAQNMGSLGKENGFYNMLGGMNKEGIFKYFFGDDWETMFNNVEQNK